MARKELNGSGFLTFYQQLAVNNPCYQRNGNRSKTTHLILHSTGANNPNLKRYVTPDDGMLGENIYKNGWNTSTANTLVHGVIGKNKNGAVEFYQIAPWEKLVWGCGAGGNGSGNSFAIQVEMCEDQTLGAAYARATFDVAVKAFAHLCKVYGIPPENIWSHNEAHDKGYASNHADPEHWWEKVAPTLTMDKFRADVKALLEEGGKIEQPKNEDTKQHEKVWYRVYVLEQKGAFRNKDNAENLASDLRKKGHKIRIEED